MRRTTLIALLAASLAAPCTSQAVELQLPDNSEQPQPYQRWADRALVPTVNSQVDLVLQPCPYEEAIGCVTYEPPTVYLDEGWARPRYLLHELGHIWDRERLDDNTRQAFMRILGYHGPWRTDKPPNRHEQFAEAYALCAVGRRPPFEIFVGYSYAPTKRQHRRVCQLIRRSGLTVTPRSSPRS